MSEILVLIVVWVLCGAGTAIVMARRGHSLLKWVPIGIALGPTAIAFALGVRADTVPERQSRRRLRRGEPGRGPVRVVVGLDGSAASEEALRTVTNLLGPRLGRLTLATVCDLDAGVGSGTPTSVEARTRLEQASATVSPVRPDLVVLSGPPAAVLAEFAREEAADLVVIGARGAGLSRRLIGSVARTLASEARPPVLIVGPVRPTRGGQP